MMSTKQKILVVGVFLSDKNRYKIYRSAADQLAEFLEKYGYQVIRAAPYYSRIPRLLNTIWLILKHRREFSLAIVPLYGGFRSFIWEDITSRLLKICNKKIALIIHGGSIPDRLKKSPNKYLKTIARADEVICPSNFIISALKNYGIESLLIENVLNLSDYTFHEKNSFRPRLFWMRTFEDVYNPLMAIRVFAELKNKYPEASMIMAGHDRGMYKQTIDLAHELNVFEHIQFPGYISNEQKNNYANEYDIYICTNLVDNAPVTFIEMMTMGLPVVTVDSGGIPYMVTDGYNGSLVKYDDVEAMVNAITHIINYPDYGKSLAQNAKQFAAQYGEQPVLAKWKSVFNKFNL